MNGASYDALIIDDRDARRRNRSCAKHCSPPAGAGRARFDCAVSWRSPPEQQHWHCLRCRTDQAATTAAIASCLERLRLSWRCDAGGSRLLRRSQCQDLAALAGRVSRRRRSAALNREVAIGMLASLGIGTETATHGQASTRQAAGPAIRRRIHGLRNARDGRILGDRRIARPRSEGVRTPIIALTADVTSAGRAACLAAGMDDYLAKAISDGRHCTRRSHDGCPRATPTGCNGTAPLAARRLREPTLDTATLAALRALPRRGSTDMLRHIGEIYLADSRTLVTVDRAGAGAPVIRGALRASAHAWRSYNGNVGALGLARLCRDLEDAARLGNLTAAREIYTRIHLLHERVRGELQSEIRRSA
jgi:CheY-like chemotaxis protein